ncbi:hypothetical protein P171DRAFT_431869 [Karstenula rhodostoma CBS 690.94]|uniref:Uncharacterized protein n=1 Tax=Karstenula rhodostoma CBS 690.94 TaxID=1392251 RepID=A0A9P4UD83_9PLEO|nr:hypothetical protein P171DRAFT_431869 [Karstenula rhodostoma CBS 690.94]
MSSVHTCFRSALTHTFRPSTADAAASWTVPAFLVPACTRPRGRPFTSAKRRSASAEAHPIHLEPALETSHKRTAWQIPQKPTRPPLSSCIPLPAQHVRADILHWLRAMDPFLPPHLRRSRSDEPDGPAASAFSLTSDASVTASDIAYFLVAAQCYSHDILSHVGLREKRWDAVVWIAKKLVGDGKASTQAPINLEPFALAIPPEQQHLSLSELTDNVLRTQSPCIAFPLPTKPAYNLDELTSIPETIEPRHRLIKRALGQLWRTLGTMILTAAEDQPDHTMIMHRVLEILAYLHHKGLIPDSVYAHKPEPDNYALQQPPTLHVLSSKILTALSDAQWRAHEASVKTATERLNASYFLGHEIPGSRYKVQVTEVAPELWLELVLWSCLHGGWTMDGSAILEEIASHRGERPWVLTSWKELLDTEGEEQKTAAQRSWVLFGSRSESVPHAKQRARMQRKISSEVVTAIVDGLVNDVRLGVGARGTTPEYLVDRIKTLKQFLDNNSLSLGSTTWDSVMLRLLESGSVVPEKRPEMVLSILDLASEFGSEVSAVNASPKPRATEFEPPYFFEPTTVPISLLHRTIRSYVHIGDIAGAMNTLEKLQQLTDQNKQKSLAHFFEVLRSIPLRQNELFTSRLPPIEFPAFENQLSVPLLAKLLDLITDANMYDLGRWFLFSEDLDGPLIRPGMYGNFVMAASIIRFGTMAGEHDLVLKIVAKTSTEESTRGTSLKHRMPHEFFTALLRSQIKLHRWASVRAMQNYALESPGFRVKPEILAQLAAELLCGSAPTAGAESTNGDARTAFSNMLYTWESLVLNDMRNELYCILAILSSVHAEWKDYCSQFLAFSAQQGMKLSTDDFNNILSGVLDGYGTLKAKEVVEKWCYQPPRMFEPYRAPGGLPTMSKYRPTKAEEYESRPENIEVHQASGAKLVLQGRIHANRQTVWAILRKVQQEYEEMLQGRGEEASLAKRGEMRETLKWAARLLYYMGFDYEDIIRDLGSLAVLADVETPVASTATLRLWEEGPVL